MVVGRTPSQDSARVPSRRSRLGVRHGTATYDHGVAANSFNSQSTSEYTVNTINFSLVASSSGGVCVQYILAQERAQSGESTGIVGG